MNAKMLATGMALTLVIVTAAFTQSQPTESENTDNLQRQVNALEARIARLEAAVFPPREVKQPPTSFVPVNDGWKKKANWDMIKNGMSENQVIKILGRPTRKEEFISSAFTLYFEGYSDEANAEVTGNIFFNNNQVNLVSPPVW